MIYVIHAVGTEWYKIGWTDGKTVQKRMADIQTGCPHDLVCIAKLEGGRREEIGLHRRYDDFRGNGEWFRLPDWAIGELSDGSLSISRGFNRSRKVNTVPDIMFSKVVHKAYQAIADGESPLDSIMEIGITVRTAFGELCSLSRDAEERLSSAFHIFCYESLHGPEEEPESPVPVLGQEGQTAAAV